MRHQCEAVANLILISINLVEDKLLVLERQKLFDDQTLLRAQMNLKGHVEVDARLTPAAMSIINQFKNGQNQEA
jgi:hypothetical protein